MQEKIWTTWVDRQSLTLSRYSVAAAMYLPSGEHKGWGPENLYVSLKSILTDHLCQRLDFEVTVETEGATPT